MDMSRVCALWCVLSIAARASCAVFPHTYSVFFFFFNVYFQVTVCVSVCVCTMIVLRMCTYIRSLFCVLKGHVSTPLGPLRRPL